MKWFPEKKIKKSTSIPTVGTNVVILDSEKRVLLTCRADNHLWCLPGGMVEVGETIEACVRREVFEETGCRVQVGDLVGVYSAPNLKLTPPARFHLIVICVFAKIIEGKPGISDEVLESKYFYSTDLPPMVPNQSERIRHALNFKKSVIL